MIKETAISLLYVKALYAGTYPIWLYISYNYDPLTKLYFSNFGRRFTAQAQFKFPIGFKMAEWIYTTSESFAGTVVKYIKSSSLLDNNKYVGTYVREICPRKLTRAFLHATFTCKLLFPLYFGAGYCLMKKSFEKDSQYGIK